MNIALSHISAQEAYYFDLANLSSRLGEHGGVNRQLLPDDFKPNASREEIESLESIGLTLPLHTLASNHHRWHRNDALKPHTAHVSSPSFFVYPIRKGLSISSPEYLFLQAASYLSFPELVAFGFEICGRYSRGPAFSQKTVYNRTPLTNVRLIQSFLHLAGSLNFTDPAKTALAYVRNNSRSPMETYIAMRLGLPRMRGGYGLGMPSMNARIDLDDIGKSISGKNHLECDLYYPEARLDIEYDSTAFHGNVSAAKNRADSARRTALEHMGIKVLTLTDVQALNEQQLFLFATHISKILGKRMRNTCKDYPERQHNLRKALLGSSRDVFLAH